MARAPFVFKKAKAEQAAIKMGLYGKAGSGKTFTSLLIAEGLAAASGKRVAFVDTEHGTDFYSREIKERQPHPEEFDFDAFYSRSMSATEAAIRSLDPKDHGVVVIDSITHLWEACLASYAGPTTSVDSIPFHAWGKIKKPYKSLITYLLSSPMHALICGREKNEYGKNDSGELEMVGVTMRAEGETPYEPHVLIRMIRERSATGQAPVKAFVEKDRSGLLAGKTFSLLPNQENGYTYAHLGAPLLALLGDSQATIPSQAETAAKDVEAQVDADFKQEAESAEWRDSFVARLELCGSKAEIDVVGAEISEAKALMLKPDLAVVRESYAKALKKIK